MHNPKSTLLDTRIISIFLMALSSIWLLRDSVYLAAVSNAGHKVYPRVCGGTTFSLGTSRTVYGLSPRVRGNLVATVLDTDGTRSIPACAGEPAARYQQ